MVKAGQAPGLAELILALVVTLAQPRAKGRDLRRAVVALGVMTPNVTPLPAFSRREVIAENVCAPVFFQVTDDLTQRAGHVASPRLGSKRNAVVFAADVCTEEGIAVDHHLAGILSAPPVRRCEHDPRQDERLRVGRKDRGHFLVHVRGVDGAVGPQAGCETEAGREQMDPGLGEPGDFGGAVRDRIMIEHQPGVRLLIDEKRGTPVPAGPGW